MWSSATKMSQQLSIALRSSLDTMNETARAVEELQLSAQAVRRPIFTSGLSLFAGGSSAEWSPLTIAPSLLSVSDLSGYSSDPRIQAVLAVLGWSGGAVLQAVWLLSSTMVSPTTAPRRGVSLTAQIWLLSLAISAWVIIKAGLSRLVMRAAKPVWRHLLNVAQDQRLDEEQPPMSKIVKVEVAEAAFDKRTTPRPRRSYGDISRVKFEIGPLPKPRPNGAARPSTRRLAIPDRRRAVSEPPM